MASRAVLGHAKFRFPPKAATQNTPPYGDTPDPAPQISVNALVNAQVASQMPRLRRGASLGSGVVPPIAYLATWLAGRGELLFDQKLSC
jgi:hypothetical protein